MPKSKILVFGATGFIGRNIATSFAENDDFDVHAVYNNRPRFEDERITWHQCNLTKPASVKTLVSTLQPKKIIQAAAATSGIMDIASNPAIHVTDNAVMNSYIFRIAAETGVEQVVFFSCTIMYQSSLVPIKESDFDANLKLESKYFGAAHTKLYLEKLCEFYASISDTKFTVIRHSNIYGPFDKYDLEKSHFLGATVSKVMTANREIVVWGEGLEKRDLLYVGDLVDMVFSALMQQSDMFQIYNCGLGIGYSVAAITEMILRTSGKQLAIRYDASKPSVNFSLILDCSHAEKQLGWTPQTTIEEGLVKTLSWWKENIDPETLMLRQHA